ncbi:excisionase family DNA-binding protein [Corynebacterium sp. CCUG 51687]|uniref:helix-turn-helix domain-containing protein n=1 Tax=Corynebacterium sp. CCUG 51687 TaxID=2823897 RepID=UPI00210A2CCC
MTTKTNPAIEVTQAVEQQASQVVANPETFHDAVRGTFPPALASFIESILARVARGESVALSRPSEVFTTTEAAEYLGISRPTLMKRIREGEIDYFKVGSHTRLHREDVVAYLQRCRARARHEFDAIRELDNEIEGL